MVGAAPNTDWLSATCQLDSPGFVIAGEEAGARTSFATPRPGPYVVGDVRAGSIKRVAGAVGEGSVAISQVWEHLNR